VKRPLSDKEVAVLGAIRGARGHAHRINGRTLIESVLGESYTVGANGRLSVYVRELRARGNPIGADRRGEDGGYYWITTQEELNDYLSVIERDIATKQEVVARMRRDFGA